MTARENGPGPQEDPLLNALGALAGFSRRTPLRPGRPVRLGGLFGAVASLLTAPPQSTGPCYDKPKVDKKPWV